MLLATFGACFQTQQTSLPTTPIDQPGSPLASATETPAEYLRWKLKYRGIELGDEWFFHKAFTPGKEAAASLGFAQQLGPEVVLDDLQRLRESLGVEA